MCSYIKNAAIILLVTCGLNCKSQQISKINQIEIATGYCHGECPFTATKIDSSLKVEFYGGYYSDKKRFYQGVITQKEWDSIISLLDSIKFQSLANRYQNTVDDPFGTYELKRVGLLGTKCN